MLVCMSRKKGRKFMKIIQDKMSRYEIKNEDAKI